jgi:peptidoglycan/LPS O-acetylase OafA/YrhL
MRHFWSLAVEEQFYLLWPLVVWLFPERRKLIWVTSLLVGLCCVLRFAAPYLSLTPRQVLYFTPTRADAILLGVLLALVDVNTLSARSKSLAKWFVLACGAVLIVGALHTRETLMDTFFGIGILLPIVNFTAVALVVAAMEERSLVSRVCSSRWACWLGAHSYSLYIFHYLFSAWYVSTLIPWLSMFMRHSFAFALSVVIVFVLSLLLSMLSYRFIEGPVMRMKGRLRYGGLRDTLTPREAQKPVFAETGG